MTVRPRPARPGGPPSADEPVSLKLRRTWWKLRRHARTHPRQTLAAVVVVAAAVGFAGRDDGQPAHVTTTPSAVDTRQASGDTRTAQLLADARATIRTADIIRVTSDQLDLTVTYHRNPATLEVRSSRQRRLVTADGRSYRHQDGCWTPSGSAPVPDPVAVLLPLNPADNARFATPKDDGDRTHINFDTAALGSFGAGTGRMTVIRGAPVTFDYTPDRTGRRVRFVVSYPTAGRPPTADRAC